MLHTLLVDVRYGTRMLVKQPLFALVAIITWESVLIRQSSR